MPVLKAAAADRFQTHLQKVISLAAYLAALVLVLRFIDGYLLDTLQRLTRGL